MGPGQLYEPTQPKFVKISSPVLASTSLAPAHVSASPLVSFMPAASCFSHFLLNQLSTSKPLIHRFCFACGLSCPPLDFVTPSIWIPLIFFFFFSISQFKVWGKSPALLIFLSKLCLKSLALGQELIQRPGRPTNRGCWRWPQVCQAQSLLPSPRRAYTTIILYSCSWAAASHFRLWIKELYMSSMPRWNTG